MTWNKAVLWRATQLPNNFDSNCPRYSPPLLKRSPSPGEPGKRACLSPDHFRSHNEVQGPHFPSESLPPAKNTRGKPSEARVPFLPSEFQLLSLSYLPDSEPPLKVTADLKRNSAPQSSQNSGNLEEEGQRKCLLCR